MEEIREYLDSKLREVPVGMKFKVSDLYVYWRWREKGRKEKETINKVFDKICRDYGVDLVGIPKGSAPDYMKK